MWATWGLFSLSLAVRCASCAPGFAPPLLNISLDEPPETRWAPILDVFDVKFLNAAMAEIIESTVPKWVHEAVAPVVEALESFMPQPYAGEIRGMAAHSGARVSDIILLNFAYEISAFCTSIVAQDTKGNVYHGRNLDYPKEILRNLTVNIHFIKQGKTLEGAVDFQEAVLRLSKTPIITGVYYIVAGVRHGEGVVITRDRKDGTA
ncbi:hypothetical protein CRUP_018672 [Coryphaenoides rupestris]|nr:hypothetical protein CRUP_018672 [Coryphaenoides rupestris]